MAEPRGSIFSGGYGRLASSNGLQSYAVQIMSSVFVGQAAPAISGGQSPLYLGSVQRRKLQMPRLEAGVRNRCSTSCLSRLLSISVLLFILPACGRKTPVVPPELAGPEATDDLTLEVDNKGITLRWGRPQEYAGGNTMEDLGGFVVLRAIQPDQGQTNTFTKVATITVEDRDRFRKTKKFTYTDDQLTAGTLYRYRVQAFTLDGYYSSPSNTVELVWKGGP